MGNSTISNYNEDRSKRVVKNLKTSENGERTIFFFFEKETEILLGTKAIEF